MKKTLTKSELLAATVPGAFARELNNLLYCSLDDAEHLRLRWDKTMMKRHPQKVLEDIRDWLETEAHEEVHNAMKG